MIIEQLRKIVEENKDKIAYKIKNESITYQTLWDKANYYANLLRKQDSQPVIIYGHKSIDMIVSIFSCILANRTYVPIDLCTPISRIKKIVELTKSSLIIQNEPLNLDKIECIKLNELEKFQNKDYKYYKNDFIYIIFTSGSSGIPKGVPIFVSNLENFIKWISNLYPLSSYNNLKVLNQASFSFDLSVADIFYALYNGHTLVGLDKCMQESYNEIFEVLSKEQINLMIITPTFIKLCLLNQDFKDINYPNLKCIYFCGEQLEIKIVQKIYERFPKIKIINAYGPTEATSAVSGLLIKKNMLKEKLLPVGIINKSAVDIEIKNKEIILKGKSVTSNYLDGTRGGFFKENQINCYKTGDIGFINNNYLYCNGRLDNQIKFKGYRIELSEIEYNLNNIKGVKDAIVIAKYNDNNIVKFIKAYVILDNGIE